MEGLEKYLLVVRESSFRCREGTTRYRTNRRFKDSIFRLLFSEKANALELLNALEDTECRDPGRIKLVTLQDAVYNHCFNDEAIQYGKWLLALIEHQSTWNENMPLREFLYLARIYEKIIDNREPYKCKLYQIPVPHLYVLYNGLQDRPQEQMQYLSHAFAKQEECASLELAVKILNINYEKHHPVLDRSPMLKQYAQFIATVRRNIIRSDMNRDEAIQQAIRDCIERDILKAFLKEHGSEVHNMFFDITDEEILDIRVEEALEDAVAAEIEKVTDRITNEVTARITDKVTAEVTAKKDRQFVTNLLKRKVSMEEIQALTDVPIRQIKKISEEMKQ